VTVLHFALLTFRMRVGNSCRRHSARCRSSSPVFHYSNYVRILLTWLQAKGSLMLRVSWPSRIRPRHNRATNIRILTVSLSLFQQF